MSNATERLHTQLQQIHIEAQVWIDKQINLKKLDYLIKYGSIGILAPLT